MGRRGVPFLACAALLVSGCGGDSNEKGGAATGVSSTDRVDVRPCPFDATTVASIIGSDAVLIKDETADDSEVGSRTACVIGVPGGGYPVDANEPWVTVTVDLPERIETSEQFWIENNPPDATRVSKPEWGDKAWQELIPYQSGDDIPDGVEAIAHFPKVKSRDVV